MATPPVDPSPQSPAAPHADAAATGPGAAALETPRALLRLVVGLALIGTDDLFTRLRDWEASPPPSSPEPASGGKALPTAGETLRAALGLGFFAIDSTVGAVSATVNFAHSVAGAVTAPLRPVARSPLTRPVRELAARGRKEYWRVIRAGLDEERRTRRLAGGVTGLLLEDVVEFAGDNSGVRQLIDAQVERLLPALVNDPTIQELLVRQLGVWLAGLSTRSESLDPLVRELGDRYIAYLNENPDDVQNLIQGQAMTMAGEARDTVRSLTVTGDSFLELLARGLLRRPPREELMPPGRRVNERATAARAISSPEAAK